MDRKPEEQRPVSRRPKASETVVTNIAWGRILCGFLATIAAGLDFGCAWADGEAKMWGLGALTLLAGAALIVHGVYASRRPPEMLLGALLVYKYKFITDEQLEQALAERARQGGKRRLGEILVEMGLIAAVQLQEVLDYQRSYPKQRDTNNAATA